MAFAKGEARQKGKKIKSPDTISERFLKLSLFSGVLLLSFFSLFLLLYIFFCCVVLLLWILSLLFLCKRKRGRGGQLQINFTLFISLSLIWFTFMISRLFNTRSSEWTVYSLAFSWFQSQVVCRYTREFNSTHTHTTHTIRPSFSLNVYVALTCFSLSLLASLVSCTTPATHLYAWKIIELALCLRMSLYTDVFACVCVCVRAALPVCYPQLWRVLLTPHFRSTLTLFFISLICTTWIPFRLPVSNSFRSSLRNLRKSWTR